eukprot:SAG11_NODE_6304_length_1341_cov_539.965378_2_plen_101_part_01
MKDEANEALDKLKELRGRQENLRDGYNRLTQRAATLEAEADRMYLATDLSEDYAATQELIDDSMPMPDSQESLDIYEDDVSAGGVSSHASSLSSGRASSLS